MKSIFSMLGNNNYEQIEEIDINKIKTSPYQTRNNFQEIAELAQSIHHYGLLSPIVLKEVDDNQYELIAGERRLRAMIHLNKNTIPAIIKNVKDYNHMFLTIIENLQRNNLNPVEEARSYKLILNETKYTHEELANKIGKSRSHLSNILRINNLPEEMQKKMIEENLTFNQIRNILSKKPKQDSKVNDELFTQLSNKFNYNKITTRKNNITFSFKNEKQKNEFINKLLT